MGIALTLLALLVAGLCDRVRGGWPAGRPVWLAHVASCVAGLCMAYVVTGWSWPILIGLAVGELSWRQDAGWRGDWVRRLGSPIDALRWGALWAVPFASIVYWFPQGLLYLVTAPLGALGAIALATRLPAVKALDLKHAWPWSELLELPLIGVLTLCVLALL